MSGVRRWYIYIVCAISLQAVAWALIALLRNLFIIESNSLAVAFQSAVIIIGLPVYLAHWLWGQRLAEKAVEERQSTLRCFYLYGSMAAFLGPVAANVFDLMRRLMQSSGDYLPYEYRQLDTGEAVIYHLAALMVMAALWFYHYRVIAEDDRIVKRSGGPATVRRLYVLGFSVAGLTITTLAVIHMIRWMLLKINSEAIAYGSLGGLNVILANEIARIIVGLAMWLVFWLWAQRLFLGGDEEERASALRKLYLYGAVFIGALVAVSNATIILAGFFRRVLDLLPEGDIRQPLPVVIGMAMVWAYHAYVLRDDARLAGEAPRQAGVRRLYYYLIAGVGFAALLVGLSGDISVILRALDSSLGSGLREELAWFTAAILAGLPVWIVPWRQAQTAAEASGPAGVDERRSVVRKIYLYFFLFLATMTVLSSAVYIVYRLLSMLLGENPPILLDIGYAISFSLIAAGVWLYHGGILRSDNRLAEQERTSLTETLRVVVVDVDDGHFGRVLLEELQGEISGLSVDLLTLPTIPPGQVEGEVQDEKLIPESAVASLSEAGLIIGPWGIAAAGGARGGISAALVDAVDSSPARKLLIPSFSNGLDWAGVDRWTSEALQRQVVYAVKRILAGDEVKAQRPLGAGAVIGIIIGVLLLLIMLVIPLLMYFA